MRHPVTLGLMILVAAALPAVAPAQAPQRINGMITLHEAHLPVFGVVHPGINAGRGGAAGPGAAPVLSDVARETMGYTRADYEYASGASDTFLQYVAALTAAGGSARTHPFISKIPIWHRNPAASAQAAIRQLNAGHVGVIMQEVESAQEVRDVIKAIRFASAGGARPDTGYALAASYWGLTPAQYHQRADVWPLNRSGELVVWAIVESVAGVANVREIAAEPGVAVLTAGYGTLGQVFAGDTAGRSNAIRKILAACKEFNKPCGFPANNPAEIQARMAEGWNVFIMQSRNDAAFAAVEAGRKIAGR